MKSIVVTGGAGFVGSNLVLELQSKYPDALITVLDDFRGSSFKNLLGFQGDVMAFNVADPRWLANFSERPVDAIFHLASITDTTVLDEQKMMLDNVEGFRNILDLAVEKKCSVVYASSAATYGAGPTKETAEGIVPDERPMTEADAGLPNNIYGYSKWTLEGLAKFYEGKVKTVGLRYFNVFGPREEFKGHAASMIYQLYKQIASGKSPRIFKYGEQRRDFIYVKDVVGATIKAKDAKKSTVTNVGTGNATSFNDLIAAINEALGTKTEPEYFDNPYDFYQNFTQADVSHLENAIGYKCQFTTHDAIIDYVRGYLEPKANEPKTASS